MLANFYTTQSPPQEGGPDPSKDNNLPDMQLRALAELAGKEGHLTGSMKYGEAVISAALYRSPDAGNNAGHSGSSFTRHRDFGVIDFGSCQNDNLDVTRRGSEELSEHLNRQRQDQPVTAGSCLVIEDSMPGIRGAKTAGMKVLAVANTHTIQDLHEAHAVAQSLSQVRLGELCERLWPA